MKATTFTEASSGVPSRHKAVPPCIHSTLAGHCVRGLNRQAGKHRVVRHVAHVPLATASEPIASTWKASSSYQQAQKQAEEQDAVWLSALVCSFFDHLNQRNLKGLFSLLGQDVTYTNSALQVTYAGKSAVSTFYVDVISSIPKGSKLVLDEVAVSNAPEPPEMFSGRHIPGTRRVSVEWHLEINGVPVPGADGVGLYRVDTSRRVLVELRDRPQAPLQMLLPALAMAAPAINLVTPVMVPAVNVIKSAGASQAAQAQTDTMSSNTEKAAGGAARPNLFQAAVNMASTVSDVAYSAADAVTGLLPSWATNMYGIPKSSRGHPGEWETVVTSNAAVPNSTAAAVGDSPPVRRAASPDLKFEPARERPAQVNNAIPMRPLVSTQPSDATPAEDSMPVTAIAVSASAKEGELQVKAHAHAAHQEVAESGELIAASFVDLPINSELIDISGLWEKDMARSDPKALEKVMDVFKLTGLKRMTARLIEGVEIKQSADTFTVNFVTVVPFFKVTETVRYDKPVNLMRRDLRPGVQSSIATKVPGGVRVAFDWGEPMAGSLEEEYVWVPDPDAAANPGSPAGALRVTAKVAVGNNKAVSVQMYRRTGKTREQLLKESKARNSSLDNVLMRHVKEFGDSS